MAALSDEVDQMLAEAARSNAGRPSRASGGDGVSRSSYAGLRARRRGVPTVVQRNALEQITARRRQRGIAEFRKGRLDASSRFWTSRLRPASRDAGLHAVLADQRQGDLYHRPARRRAAPVGSIRWSTAPTPIFWKTEICSGPAGCRKGRSTWAAAAGCCANTTGTARCCGSTGTSASITTSAACRTATPSSSAGRWCRRRSQRRIPGGLAGTSHPDGCMYGDNILEITPDGKTVWEWHACRDMEVEKYPLMSNQLRDEFAHANAISPLPNGDIYISFRRLNMIGLIDQADQKDEMGASRRQLRHAARLRAAAERQHHAVRQRHQHHDQSVLARDRARSAHAQDGVGVSRQARLHVLQPAHQRRAAACRPATR